MLSHSTVSTKPRLNPSKYRLLGLVGQGQFGQVFCAVHRQTGQLVALKNLEQKRFPTHQFLRELRFLLSLQHPNIVTCLAIEHTKTGRYLVMDYCEGGTLRSLMAEESHLSIDHSLKLIASLLIGLEHAHNRGIIHCDIKPENILLRLEPKGWIAKISDFGVARLFQELSQQRGTNTGSPAYMAPERFYGQYSQTSDLYSVGIMLFEMLTGYRPFSGAPGALMDAHLNQTVQFPDGIPEPLRHVIKASLEKLSARRYASATEMLLALNHAADALGIVLDSSSIALDTPLIESRVVPIACPFKPRETYLLNVPVHWLGHEKSQVNTSMQHTDNSSDVLACYASQTQVGQYLRSTQTWQSLQLPEVVNHIALRPQGCFVVTSHAIYHVAESSSGIESSDLVLVHQFSQDCFTTLDQQGKWVAVVSDMRQVLPKSGFSTLSFHPLPNSPASVSLATHPIPLKKAGQTSSLLQVIALDHGHVAIFSDLPPLDDDNVASEGYSAQKQNHVSGTYIEIITRRGNRLGSLSLPMLLGHVVPTATPYRFLATDRYDLYSILQVDLKPFRVARFAVQVIPKFIAAANWGYLVVNQQGHIVLLDQSGGQVNRIEGPPNPTAIALFEPSGLLIATWDENQGHLYTVDLKDLQVDIVF